MTRPSLASQIAAVEIAVDRHRALAKDAGLRSAAQVDLLLEQLAAAAETLRRQARAEQERQRS